MNPLPGGGGGAAENTMSKERCKVSGIKPLNPLPHHQLAPAVHFIIWDDSLIWPTYEATLSAMFVCFADEVLWF